MRRQAGGIGKHKLSGEGAAGGRGPVKNCFSTRLALGKNHPCQSPCTRERRASGAYRFPPGYAAGRSSCWAAPAPPSPSGNWPTPTLAEEVNRLEKALVQTRHQILEVQRKVSEGMGAQEGSIFDAHLLVLEDRTLIDEVVRVIQEQKVNAEHAFHTVAERYAATLVRHRGRIPARARHRHARRDRRAC